MRAILIDPVRKTVTVVEHNGDYREIHKLLSDEESGLHVDTFTCVRINERDAIFVDDNGLYQNDDNPQFFFLWRGYHQPLAGRGLILGADKDGETIGAGIPLQDACEHVTFPKGIKFVGLRPIPEGTVTGPDHPLGEGISVFGHTPIFSREEDRDEDKV
jgi:hypothetical protein